ncbi:MAG: ribosome maturation factor RimP [Myxococcota bacterium]
MSETNVPKSTAERAQALVTGVVEREGYELVDVEFISERGRAILRMYVDTIPPGDEQRGITVDDCSHLSRIISDVLDVEETIGGRYHLEVSSPGLFRPLTKPAHFERVVGQRIKIKTYAKIENRRVFTGTLTQFAEGHLAIEVDGQPFSLALSDIAKANLEPELSF